MFVAAGAAETFLTEGEEAKGGSSRAVGENSKVLHDASGVRGIGVASFFTGGMPTRALGGPGNAASLPDDPAAAT
jgi:hypothetical protein